MKSTDGNKSIGNAQNRIGKQIGTQYNRILNLNLAGITPYTMRFTDRRFFNWV